MQCNPSELLEKLVLVEHKGVKANVQEQEIDELVDEWTPEPLVAPQTAFEEAENDKRVVIAGSASSHARETLQEG